MRFLVRRHAKTEMAGTKVSRLAPLERIDELREALRRVGEMLELRQKGVRLLFEGIVDPLEAIARLKIEGTALDPLTLLNLARLCDRALEARTAIVSERDGCPTLFEIVAPLPTDLGRLSASINCQRA